MRTILLLTFFYSIVALILPLGKCKSIIAMLVVSIVVCSMLSVISKLKFEIPVPDAESLPAEELSPEQIAVANYLASEIERITGSPPVSIETNLKNTKQGLKLTELWIIIGSGDPEEVERELRQVFSWQEITVFRAENSGRDENICLDP